VLSQTLNYFNNYLNVEQLMFMGTSILIGITLTLIVILVLIAVKCAAKILILKLKEQYAVLKIKYRRRPPSALKKALGQQNRRMNLEKYLSKLSLLIPPGLLRNTTYVVVASILSAAIFLFCIGYLNNFPAAVLGGIAVALIVSQITTHASFKNRDVLNKQLPMVIRNFASMFEQTEGNFRVALDAIVERTADPARGVFYRVRKKLDSGIHLNEALAELEKRADTGHVVVLRRLLVEAEQQGISVQPKLLRLASQIDAMEDIGNENMPDVVSSRALSVLLHASIIVLTMLTTLFVPNAKEYIIYDPVGKTIITFCFMSVIISIISDRILNNVGDV